LSEKSALYQRIPGGTHGYQRKFYKDTLI